MAIVLRPAAENIAIRRGRFLISIVPDLPGVTQAWLGYSEAVPQENRPLGHRFAMSQPPITPIWNC